MKKILLIAALFAASTSVFAQKGGGSAFDQGTGFAHVGIGFGGGFYTGSATLPPISVSYEKGVTSNISVGGILGYASSNYNLGSGYVWKYSYILIGARGNYHFATSDKLDPYAGLTLGYNIVSASQPSGYSGGYTASASALLLGAQLGANYYFSDNVGGFAELGYGIGIFTIGVSFKL